jgi:1,4-dihydroxy-2-naphthoate octaprenyltransferase
VTYQFNLTAFEVYVVIVLVSCFTWVPPFIGLVSAICLARAARKKREEAERKKEMDEISTMGTTRNAQDDG